MLASLLHTISTHSGDITSISFTHGKLASASADKTVRLWSTEDFSELPCSPVMGHHYTVHHCTFSPFGTMLATCSTDGKLILWDAKTGEVRGELQHESKSGIRVCSFSPDSAHIVSGGDDDTICMWEVATKRLVRSYTGHEDTVVALAYSPDGMYLVSGDPNGDLYVWDAAFGHGRYLSLKVDAHDLGVTCCEFSPSFGTAGEENSTACTLLLATSGKDNLVKLWIFTAQVGSAEVSLKCRDSLAGHSDIVMSCTFSPSGHLLASGSLDKSVRLWDPVRGTAMFKIDNCHSRFVTCCGFSPDASLLATGSMDRAVNVWKLTDTADILEGLTGYEAPTQQEAVTVAEDRPVESWTVEEVAQWLDTLGLSRYQDSFTVNAIDGRELLALTSAQLEASLGVASMGDRNKILRGRDVRTGLVKKSLASSAGHRLPASRAKDPHEAHNELLCPITMEIMRDPVIAADGYTYDRPAIQAWLETGKDRSPMTNAVLPHKTLTPNRTLKMVIQKHLEQAAT